ncbi:MAG: iron-containing alcohol dehydrogenase [Synergistaceae bacterium]|jgi:glycerol-1-phosphate dehydrogenase [NAD(P)+]|nr:iron-containing alcohol dehydrogenase [Synergistaceae bacterium]
MLNKLPPPVLKYDIGDMPKLMGQIQKWSDRDKIPDIELKEVWAGRDAVLRVTEAFKLLGVAPGSDILVVMDEVKYWRSGKSLKDDIVSILRGADYAVETRALKGDSYGIVHATFKEVEEIKALLSPSKSVLSIGSGAITDIAKHACFLYEQETGATSLPLVSLMTASTVGAYTSRMSIISKDNVKRTWPSRTPDILIMDLQVLMDCPRHFSVAGAGDTMPVFCAFADWYFADRMGMGSFLDASWRIVDDIKDLLIPYASEIARGTANGMEVCGKCVLETGLCMTYARDSVPVSGYEHVISHMLDMTANYDGRQTGIHGQQVGIASVLSTLNLEFLIRKLDEVVSGRRNFKIDSCYPDTDIMRDRIMRIFHEIDTTGAMGAECWKDYGIKLQGWRDARPKFERFLDDWDEHKATLSELLPRSAAGCAKGLRALGMPLKFDELTYPVAEERGRWAFRNAMFMRKRLTAADVAFFMGFADEAWENEIFAKYHELIDLIKEGT